MKMHKIFAISMSLCLSLVLLLSSCGQQEAPPTSSAAENPQSQEAASAAEEIKPVKIAVAFALSGTNAEAGKMGVDAVTLAVGKINESGGIKSLGGAPVEMVIADITSDPGQSKQVVERLLADEEISALVGCGSSALMLPVLPVLEKARIPAVTNCNAPGITNQGYKYVFSITHPGAAAGSNVVRCIDWLNNEMGYSYKKVAIVYENSAFGISSAEGSREDAEKYGLEIVFDESFAPGITDASAIVTAMKNSGAEVFIPATYASESKLFIETMRTMDYHPLIIGPVAWPSLAEGLGESVNGILSTGNWNPYTRAVQDNPDYAALVDEYFDAYGYFMTEVSGANYQATWVIKEAIELCASRDGAVIRDTISGSTFENTIMTESSVKFDETGQNINAKAVLAQWQNGIPYAIYPVEYSVAGFIDPKEIN